MTKVEPTFTPGPWEAVEWTDEVPLPMGVVLAVQRAGTHGPQGRICEIVAQGSDGEYSPEVTNANARLLAAAPRLLAALQRFTHAIANCNSLAEGIEAMHAEEEAHAAISEALGQQPTQAAATSGADGPRAGSGNPGLQQLRDRTDAPIENLHELLAGFA